jgi:hypothetical protein
MTLLKKILGPSQREIWEQLCLASGAVYVPGGFLKRRRVRKRIRNWTVTLEASTSSGPPGSKITTTRLRVPFVSKGDFRFTIERKSAGGKIGKPIGRHYISCGHPDFDADFWVKSRDDTKARDMLDDQGFREMLQAQTGVWLTVKDHAGWFGPKFPENVDMLVFEEIDARPMTSVGRLQSLFDLMGASLEQLCRIGSATGDDPGVVV